MSLFKPYYKASFCYCACAIVNSVPTGHRYWHYEIFPKMYKKGEERLVSREILNYTITIGTIILMHIAPQFLIFSMYRNAQRIEIHLKNLDKGKYTFYYDYI